MSKSASAFRRTETIELPNGLEVQVRKPDLQRLALNAKDGEIPSFLRQQILEALNGKAKTREQVQEAIEQDSLQVTIDNAHEYASLLALVTKAALVWPVIKDNPTPADYEDGFISIDDLTLADQMRIVTWAMPSEAQAAKSFRGEPGAVVAVASDVRDVQPETVASIGD